MSTPIRYCVLVKAFDDPEEFKRVHPVMHANLRGGHFTLVGCRHDPPCRELVDEELDDLQRRFMEPLGQ